MRRRGRGRGRRSRGCVGKFAVSRCARGGGRWVARASVGDGRASVGRVTLKPDLGVAASRAAEARGVGEAPWRGALS